jgi:hypothetical protein
MPPLMLLHLSSAQVYNNAMPTVCVCVGVGERCKSGHPAAHQDLPANFLIRREVAVGIRRLENLKSAEYREVGLAWLCWLHGANYATRLDRCVSEPAST